MPPEEVAAELAKIKEALVTAGYRSIGDLITAHQAKCAECTQAIESRNNFKGDADEAQVHIRKLNGKFGELNQTIKAQEAEIENLKGEKPTGTAEPGSAATTAAPVPATAAPVPVVSEADEIKALEDSLTDAHWQRADELMTMMKSKGVEVEQYLEGGKSRLDFLKGVRDDLAVKKPEPTTMRPTRLSAPQTPTVPAETPYETLLKSLGQKTPAGPGGPPGVQATGAPAGPDTRPRAGWAKTTA